MKKILLAFLALLTFLPAVAAADTTPTPLTIEEVTAKIRQKDSFYLFVGREDNVDSQLALTQLAQASANKPVYFLNTKQVDTKKYKAFAKKYNIRTVAYLASFANRKQTAVFSNDWRASENGLEEFLNQP